MDEYAKQVVRILKPYIGDAAGLMLLREIRELHMTIPLTNLTIGERIQLSYNIVDHLLVPVVSLRRVPVFRSKVFRALGISSEAIRRHEQTERPKWSI